MAHLESKELEGDRDFLRRLVVGIGEVAEVTGIPQRQIRYWEQKGIIAPVAGPGSVRRYDYATIKKMLLVKELLDEGYTLDTAAAKVAKRLEFVNSAFQKLRKRAR